MEIRIKNENCTMAGKVCRCEDGCGDCTTFSGPREDFLKAAGEIRRNLPARKSRRPSDRYALTMAKTLVEEAR